MEIMATVSKIQQELIENTFGQKVLVLIPTVRAEQEAILCISGPLMAIQTTNIVITTMGMLIQRELIRMKLLIQ